MFSSGFASEKKGVTSVNVIGFTDDITQPTTMLNSIRGINSLFGRDSGRKRSFITPIIPQFLHPFRNKVNRSDRTGKRLKIRRPVTIFQIKVYGPFRFLHFVKLIALKKAEVLEFHYVFVRDIRLQKENSLERE